MTEKKSSNTGSSTGPWVLRGKLRPPIRNLSLIERPRLLSSFDELLGFQASIIVAPAGFGKTTILAQWRERQLEKSHKVGWLTIDGQDDDPYRFLCYAIFALSDAGVDTGQLGVLAEQGLPELALDSVIVSLLSLLETDGHPIVFIVDDYHRVEASGVDEVLDKLIENAPGNVHIVISSRNKPNLGIAHLCITGRGIEVDGERLRFTASEISQALGKSSSPDFLEAVTSATEGWPVAVQLARLALGSGKDVQTVFAVAGRDSHIADFFSEQVVDELPQDAQQFLIRTSILDQMSPELANAVYGGDEAWRYFRELDHLSVLIVSLDVEGDWYRYHHLFADFLVARLKEKEPGRISELHHRASVWYEEDGDTYQAVRHAVQAQDNDRAVKLIEAAGGWELILFGGIGYLRNLINLVPRGQLEQFPRLEIAQAYLSIKTGEIATARTHFDHAIAQFDTEESQQDNRYGFERDVMNIGALLSVYEDDEVSARALFSLPAQQLPTGEPDSVTNAVLQCQRATYEMYTGQFEAARSDIRAAMQSMRRSSSVLGLNYCYIHAALNNFHICNFNQAFANAREASNMAVDNFGNDSGLKSLSDIVLTTLLFWTNQTAEIDWARFETAIAHSIRYDGWFEIYSLALETQVERCLLQRNYDIAHRAIATAKHVANERSMERLDRYADSMQVYVHFEETGTRNFVPALRHLRKTFQIGAWRENRFSWRVHTHCMLVLAEHYCGTDTEKSEAHARDAIECSRHIGAQFSLVRSLSTYASILDRANRRQHALEVLAQAIEMAEPQGLTVVLARTPGLVPLLRHAQGAWRAEALDTATIRFVGSVLEIIQSNARDLSKPTVEGALSPRESEVILELSLGRSNKEIARALDMTEHTVKFHLKNIFRKLSVNRRTEALKVARERGIV